MQKIVKKIFSAPSIRLNTLVLLEIVTLLMVSLGGLLFFTRKVLVEESKKDAEQCLEGTVQRVDNMLMSIEQTAGNFYYSLTEHLDEPESMTTYCQRIVECNPDIEGCAIAFKPNYYPEHEKFLAYVYRKSYNSPELLSGEAGLRIPYTEQFWYTETMKTCRPGWLDPGQNHVKNIEPVITFCLPIHERSGECVGVVAIGLSINLLSQIVLENKPTINSYCMLLGNDGSYIIHPDRKKLHGRNVLTEPEVTESPTALNAFKVMLGGHSGDMSFMLHDVKWYMFFKPFVRTDIPGRSMEALNWSIATIYPKTDIFGDFYDLVIHVVSIVLIALLVFYMLCRIAIRRQLKPLIKLTETAEHIAEGDYDETIPNTTRDDEVGIFQKHFRIMQQALEADIKKQEEQQATLQKHREELEKTYKQIQEDDKVKNTFLHNVTNRMIAPAEAITDSVENLCDHYQDIELTEADKEANNIKKQSDTILELLSHKFKPS